MKENRLTLLGPAEPRLKKDGRKEAWGVFKCSCGVVVERRMGHWKTGRTGSCGCLRDELLGRPFRSHGMSSKPIYHAWCSMKRRCTPALWAKYPTYTGTRCDPRWETFEGFLAHPPAGKFEPGMALSRYGDQGDYTPENTRWITRSENSREVTERSMIRLDDGRFALDVAREHGINPKTMRTRISRGWDPEVAAITPPGKSREWGLRLLAERRAS